MDTSIKVLDTLALKRALAPNATPCPVKQSASNFNRLEGTSKGSVSSPKPLTTSMEDHHSFYSGRRLEGRQNRNPFAHQINGFAKRQNQVS